MMVLSADARVPGTERGGTDNPNTESGDLVIWGSGEIKSCLVPMSSRVFNAGWLVGAVLLSSWAVSSASDAQRPVRVAAAVPTEPALPPLAVEVDAEIARLEAWTNARAAAPAAKRNLFEFEVRGAKFEVRKEKFEVLRATAPDSTSNVELRTPNFAPPALTAIAEQSGAMTAVISFQDALHYVKKGDVIAERFRVDVIGAQGVEIFDLTLGTILRLSLYVAS